MKEKSMFLLNIVGMVTTITFMVIMLIMFFLGIWLIIYDYNDIVSNISLTGIGLYGAILSEIALYKVFIPTKRV